MFTTAINSTQEPSSMKRSFKKLASFFKKGNGVSDLSLLSPSSINRSSITASERAAPQNIELLIQQISAQLMQREITRSPSEIRQYLRLNYFNVPDTTQQLTCLSLAEVGILVDMSNSSTLIGVENSSGTSCYIDTILFAMYSQETAFDCLLHSRPLKVAGAELLQAHCRFFVNLLRSGSLIRGETVELIRKQLIKCGWGTTRHAQEDAVELFLFLTDVFELPFLPLNVKLFHGAKEDLSSDDKFMADRVLALSLPDIESSSNTPELTCTDGQSIASSDLADIAPGPCIDQVIAIEDLLMQYFYSNRIAGIRRKLFSEDNNEKTAITDAWSALQLLPFYTSQNELGSISNLKESDLTDPDLILPLMIKRYTQSADGLITKRDKRPVSLSTDINFNNFIKKLDDATTDRSKSEYRLHLKAVVCHLGDTVQSGHYIVFVRDPKSNDWVQMDDLQKKKVTRHTTVKQATEAFEIMSRNSYLLLYQLRNGSSSTPTRSNTSVSLDAKIARKIQAHEFLRVSRNRSCNLQ